MAAWLVYYYITTLFDSYEDEADIPESSIPMRVVPARSSDIVQVFKLFSHGETRPNTKLLHDFRDLFSCLSYQKLPSGSSFSTDYLRKSNKERRNVF